jgi:hypothetical protein
MGDPSEIVAAYRRFAEIECRGYSEAYEHMALAVADDSVVIRFLAEMPVSQPNLFFASVQCLTGPARMPRTSAELRALLRLRGPEVRTLMRSRRTQTNEVGRCAALLPALPAGPGPLALVEVGASAGLCLLLDRYHYDYGSAAIGPAASPVRLPCAVRGPAPLPTALPTIAWRRGLDRDPVDLHADESVGWLLACVWSDHPERRRRLEAAIALAKADAPVVSRGDLVDDLPALLAEAPDDAELVVFHSAVLSYVSADRRQAFAGVLAEASKRRPIVWVSNEAYGIVREITALAPQQREHQFLLGRTRFTDGRRRDELLALAHPHGAALSWR